MRRAPERLAALCFLTLLALVRPAPAAPPTCAGRTAIQAGAALDRVRDWADIDSYRAAFAACDDGEYSEHLADTIVKLLASGPERNRTLFDRARSNAKFLAFVLDHIDSTADSDALDRIAEAFGGRCSATDRDICARIASAARSATQ
jgi:hypothetical protein